MKTISSAKQAWRTLCVSSALAGFMVTAGVGFASLTAQAQSSDASRTLATGTRLPLSASAPDQYTVKQGDTLWGISKLYLDQPWYWPELWYLNPQVKNPHLIFPGDVLALVNVDGQKRLTISQRGPVGAEAAVNAGIETGAGPEAITRGDAARLSPQVHSSPLPQSITAIPYNVMAAFMGRPSILTTSEVKSAPYIVGLRNSHVLGGAGDDVYARGIGSATEGTRYNVVHVNEELRDPDSHKLLGYSALYVGNGPVIMAGDPAKITLSESAREVLPGDKVIAEAYSVNADFVPHAPHDIVKGRIFAVSGVYVVGQYQVVAINRGITQGLEPGEVLAIYQKSAVLPDRYSDGRSANPMETPSTSKKVRLPEERIGTVLVFKAYEHMSYALIVETTDVVRNGDLIRNP